MSALDAIDDLNETFVEMDALGVPATYTSTLRNEQAALRRSILRVYHVQRTEFLPSAFLLIYTIVVIIIATLLFMEIEPAYEAAIIIGFISFFFLSLLALLRLMDRPFQRRGAHRGRRQPVPPARVHGPTEPLGHVAAADDRADPAGPPTRLPDGTGASRRRRG